MKDKKIIVVCIVFVAVLLIGSIASVLTRKSYASVGIEELETIYDVEKLGIQTWEEGTFIPEEDMSSYVEALDAAASVMVVEPKEAFAQYWNSYSQEVMVKKVIRGKEELTGKTVTVYNIGGFKNSNGEIVYESNIGLMYPDSQYLIFLDESELNEYGSEKEFFFYDYGAVGSCINLDEENLQGIEKKIVDKYCE